MLSLGRVNVPILILNITVLVAALALIIYAVVVYNCASILIILPIGLVLLICPLTCLCVTIIGKSQFSIYIRDEPSASVKPIIMKTDLDKTLTDEEIAELENIETELDK